MTVPRDHDIDALRRRIAKAQQVCADVAHDDAQAEGIDLGLQRDAGQQLGRIGVAEHRRDWSHPTEALENAAADVAGVDDALRPCEQVVEEWVVVAVRVADDADEGLGVHVCRIQTSMGRVQRSVSRRRRGSIMKGLAGKRVVITGGTSGIGAATAQRFRDEGSDVVVLARRPGPDVLPCDVSDRAQVTAAFARIGNIDVLVNNAGVSYRGPAVDITEEQWTEVVATDLNGAFWVAQAAGRQMLAGAGGVILNTASTNALVGYRHYAHYNAAKAGLVSLSQSLALEWAPKVRVNVVCPGYVLTPMQEAEYTPEMFAELNARIPLGRHGTPEELAGLFAYLASDEATYFTGAVIAMDGGDTAGSVVSGGGPGA